MDKTVFDLIYLYSCALNGKKPEEKRLCDMDFDKIYTLAGRHMIKAAVGAALEGTGYGGNCFKEAVGTAVRRTVIFEREWDEIKGRFEKENVEYAALKGAVLKSYYGRYGMREFADHDILIKPDRACDVKAIMEDSGYTVISYGASNHDVYQKPPFLNFEIHTALFGTQHDEAFYKYYLNIFDRLKGDGCEKRFSDEDFYLYIVCHEYKHYSNGGTGLRSLGDTYVFLKKTALDMDYVRAEAEKLGISEFEKQNRELSQHLFDLDGLTEDEVEMLRYILSSGTYGTINHRVDNAINKNGGSKLKYMFSRFFVPFSKKNKNYASYAGSYPFFYKHKILLPFLPFYRLIRSIKSGHFKHEAKAIKNAKKKSR